jgi:hypothetical protein
MSVGGKVVDVRPVSMSKWWVNTDDSKNPAFPNLCAVYVDPQGCVILEGDSLWWHGDKCYWTPQDRPYGVFDIELPKLGYSGVPKPLYEGEDA